MGFAQTDAAVKEEGVVRIAGSVGNTNSCRFDELIRAALDKGLESVVPVELGFEHSRFLFFSGVGNSNGWCWGCEEGLWFALLLFDDELDVRLAERRDGQEIYQFFFEVAEEVLFNKDVRHLQHELISYRRGGLNWAKPVVVGRKRRVGLCIFEKLCPSVTCVCGLCHMGYLVSPRSLKRPDCTSQVHVVCSSVGRPETINPFPNRTTAFVDDMTNLFCKSLQNRAL